MGTVSSLLCCFRESWSLQSFWWIDSVFKWHTFVGGWSLGKGGGDIWKRWISHLSSSTTLAHKLHKAKKCRVINLKATVCQISGIYSCEYRTLFLHLLIPFTCYNWPLISLPIWRPGCCEIVPACFLVQICQCLSTSVSQFRRMKLGTCICFFRSEAAKANAIVGGCAKKSLLFGTLGWFSPVFTLVVCFVNSSFLKTYC